MPRGGYRSRHAKPSGSSPPNTKYTFQAWKEYSEVPLQRDEQDEDDARLKALRERDSKSWRQKDWALWDELCRRKEEREDEQRAPLRRELESYFDELGLPTLPPPMAKSSLWLEITRPCNYENENVRPFYVACEEGQLEEVRTWVERKKDLLQQIGLQDGLACAAKGDQVDVARYLLDGGYASLHGAVVQAAVTNRSLPLFTLALHHGYHPNQQIPSRSGGFGTALPHVIDNEAIVRLLLAHGADPNVAPFHDNRKSVWGLRATPPMDRTAGLALDLAVKTGNTKIIDLLLEHGAEAKYARPLHGVISLREKRREAEREDADADVDWQPLMENLIRHGADVNATTYGGGTPLHKAAAAQMWDVAEFLLSQGADPRIAQPATGLSAFAVAAKAVRLEWEKTDEMDNFVEWLCDGKVTSSEGGTLPNGVAVRENPLVKIAVKQYGISIRD